MTIAEFKSTPLGSLLLIPDEERQNLLQSFFKVPPSLKRLASSPKTGAYLRGLAKAHNVPEGTSSIIAFAVLEVALGKLSLAQLAATLSSRIRIANDKAQKIAKEIEHDLIGPVAADLNKYIAAQKNNSATTATATARQAGATNVLNLKQEPKRPTPPPIPRLPKP